MISKKYIFQYCMDYVKKQKEEHNAKTLNSSYPFCIIMKISFEIYLGKKSVRF